MGRRKDGFTLIELIVVIAILGILAAVLIPSVTGYVRRAKESACAANRSSILRMYEIALTDRDGGDHEERQALLQAVLENADHVYHQSDIKCPGNGSYTAFLLKSGKAVVLCSEHMPTATDSELAETVAQKAFASFQEVVADFLAHPINSGDSTVNAANRKYLNDTYGFSALKNDEIRRYVYSKTNAGKWDTIEFIDKDGASVSYTVMPFFLEAELNNGGTADDITIYARPTSGVNGDGNSQYHVNLIYNDRDGRWYQGRGGVSISSNSMTHSKLMDFIEKEWSPIT